MKADISGDLNALAYAVKRGIGTPAELIKWADEILAANPRDAVPDWVEAISNGNPECWDSVLDVAREMMQEDERIPDEDSSEVDDE
jgi:hypothetical protein